ncbi:hypothetical protein ACQKL5_03610 [Peribacillus sp. NPDC097675]|uniref:hypothetical protein n=1 Tax=Peribacillus sp. NPDC097675 TaxID=3390618 RepID=UPI003CFF152E
MNIDEGSQDYDETAESQYGNLVRGKSIKEIHNMAEVMRLYTEQPIIWVQVAR